jgi:phage/plasmid-like protein (TIGR03299 family)
MTKAITRNPSHRLAPWESVDAAEIAGLGVKEAVSVAGLDYHVAKVPLVAEVALPESNDPTLRLPRKVDMPDQRLTVNQETGDVLGIVGKGYQVIQTEDVVQLMDALVGDGWSPEWAGKRRGGGQTFMFGKLPYEMVNLPDVNPYMGFLNSFDGSTALRVVSTALVPSCTNAITTTFYGLGNRSNTKNTFSFKHTANVWNRIDAAREALKLQVVWAQEMDRQIGVLLDQELSRDEGVSLVNKLIPCNAEVINGERIYRDQAGKILSGRAVTVRTNKREDILGNWKESDTILPSARMTGWGLIQAISEVEQHANRGDSTAQTERLMDRVVAGRVGNLTEKAWGALVAA